jgi:hypothetical protein
MKFKYQEQLDSLLNEGIEMPDQLYNAENLLSYRYVFDSDHPHNHIPAYIINPRRMLQEKKRNNLSCLGFSLSCFSDKDKAIGKFSKISKTNKNFWKTAGNSICSGTIENSFGVITEPNSDTHFELFEFEDCDLKKTFDLIRRLV